jgi:Protein of unknown function (DUF2586)
MTLPAVIITEQDGALGVLPPSAGRLLAVLGTAEAGPIATPATFGRVKDLIATFTAGPAVEAAAHWIDTYGKPVVFVRVDAAAGDTGEVSTITANPGAGTAVVTVAAGATPNDSYEVVWRVVVGGTVGTAGITYQFSLDGGRSYGAVTALGTAVLVAVPGAGGVSIEIGTGTLTANATYAFRTTHAAVEASTIGAAIDALAASVANWELALFADPITPMTFDQIELKWAGLHADGKYRAWLGNVRMPDAGETEQQYLDAMVTAFGASVTVHGSLYFGSCKLISSISSRQYKRPVVWPVAAREQHVSEETNVADINLGSLIGVSIRDANGNPDEHDESIFPGADDARFGTLRTWDGLPGVYVTRPRVFSAEGSDFRLLPHRRVMNLAHMALRSYFLRRLNKPIRVDRVTGFVLEEEALEIEAGAIAAMSSTLLAKPKASAVQFALSRTDNVLSTMTLTGTARVIPLAYPEWIELDVGFANPALIVQAA